MRLVSLGVCFLLVVLLLIGCSKKEQTLIEEGGDTGTPRSAEQGEVDEPDNTAEQQSQTVSTDDEDGDAGSTGSPEQGGADEQDDTEAQPEEKQSVGGPLSLGDAIREGEEAYGEFVSILKTVEDQASAEAAGEKLRGVIARFEELAARTAHFSEQELGTL